MGRRSCTRIHPGKQRLVDIEGRGLSWPFGLPGYFHFDGQYEAMEKPQKDEGISMSNFEHYIRRNPGDHRCHLANSGAYREINHPI